MRFRPICKVNAFALPDPSFARFEGFFSLKVGKHGMDGMPGLCNDMESEHRCMQ